MIRRYCCVLYAFFFIASLVACGTKTALPVQGQALQGVKLPLQLHLRYQEAGFSRDAIVVIQRETETLRFLLFDAMGVPQARLILRDGSWRADGLLPPHPYARQWFAGVLFALTSTEHLAQQYPDVTTFAQQRTLANGWRVLSPAPEHWQIIFSPQQTLQVEQMEWQP